MLNKITLCLACANRSRPGPGHAGKCDCGGEWESNPKQHCGGVEWAGSFGWVSCCGASMAVLPEARTSKILCLRQQRAAGFIRAGLADWKPRETQHRISAGQACFAAIEAAPRSLRRGLHDAFPRTLPTTSPCPSRPFPARRKLANTHSQSLTEARPKLTRASPDPPPAGAARLSLVQEPPRPEVSAHYLCRRQSRPEDWDCDCGCGPTHAGQEPRLRIVR